MSYSETLRNAARDLEEKADRFGYIPACKDAAAMARMTAAKARLAADEMDIEVVPIGTRDG